MSHYPNISCLCPTYGRPELLEESIECYLRQDYQGRTELIILNDLPEQVLSIDDSRVNDGRKVVVYNAHKRSKNLGAKMNTLAHMSEYPWIMHWDDDDIQLPWAISGSMDSLIKKNSEIGCLKSSFFDDGDTLTYVPTTPPPGPFLMKKEQLWSVGGMTNKDCGVDQDLWEQLRHKNKHPTRMDCRPSYVYRWATNGYHLSGYGFDEHKAESALGGWDQVGVVVNTMIQSGQLPSGDISLKPHLKEDWVLKCAEVMEYYSKFGNRPIE